MGTLAALGLAMLFFIAGSEIDFGVFRERTGRRAVSAGFSAWSWGCASVY